MSIIAKSGSSNEKRTCAKQRHVLRCSSQNFNTLLIMRQSRGTTNLPPRFKPKTRLSINVTILLEMLLVCTRRHTCL